MVVQSSKLLSIFPRACQGKTSGIPGNDAANLETAIHTCGKLWYVIFTHATERDKDFDFEVTKYWNGRIGARGKVKDLLSYGGRMKHAVALTEMLVLEINAGNKKHLLAFNQGKNSNGNARNQKVFIPVSGKHIDNFLIHRMVLE